MEANIDKALGKAKETLTTLEGVSGVWQGEQDGRPCIVVYVEDGTDLTALLPKTVDGVPVVVQRGDPLRSLSD